MKEIFKNNDFKVYVLSNYTDIQHIEILLTRINKKDDKIINENLIINANITYQNNELYCYKFNSLDDYSIQYHNKYIDIISDAIIKYLKLKNYTRL